MRELNSLEKRAKTEMLREEKRIVQQKNKEKEQEIMEWRGEQREKSQELQKRIEEERTKIELQQNRQFCEFKKQRRKAVSGRVTILLVLGSMWARSWVWERGTTFVKERLYQCDEDVMILYQSTSDDNVMMRRWQKSEFSNFQAVEEERQKIQNDYQISKNDSAWNQELRRKQREQHDEKIRVRHLVLFRIGES